MAIHFENEHHHEKDGGETKNMEKKRWTKPVSQTEHHVNDSVIEIFTYIG